MSSLSTAATLPTGAPPQAGSRRAPSPNDRRIPSRLRYLARVWPVATAGRLGAYALDPATRSFAMVATATRGLVRGGKATDTAVFLPSTVRGPVHVGGAATIDAVVTRPDGSRMAYLSPHVAASSDAVAPPPYVVTVGPASATLRSGVAAANPPAPIAEPQARALALAALDSAAHSSDPSVRSTAQLVQGLAGIVLGAADPNG